MLDIRAYGDESDTPETHFVLTLALASFDTWQRVDSAWTAVVDREGLTEFHASDCAQGNEEFEHLSNEQRMALYREFVEIIARHQIHTVAVVIDNAHYPVVAAALPIPEFAKPWPFAFVQLLVLATRVAPPAEPIAFMFDEQREFASKALDAFAYYKQTGSPLFPDLSSRLSRIAFGDSKRHSPLQVADLLAYEVKLRFRLEKRPRKSWEAIVGQLPSVSVSYCGQQQVERFAALARELFQRGIDVWEMSDEERDAILNAVPAVGESIPGLLGSFVSDLADFPSPDWEDEA